ncbi:hypothetical protein H6F77_18305 [Microcoleus sp. FACHB-831]|nr:hypothetical protein [Microcoleus sp. FACHB-831]
MSNFLSAVAVLLSTLALACSGFAAYQVYKLSNSSNRAAVPPIQVVPVPVPSSAPASSSDTAQVAPQTGTTTLPEGPTVASPAPVTSPATTTIVQTPVATVNAEFTPGQFVQTALGNKAQVELLSAKRIQNPETKNRDVVNVQMRIRRLTDPVTFDDVIRVYETTARNPDTTETYKAVDGNKRSTVLVNLPDIRSGASADAYVWLRVPEGTNRLDIYVPETGAFKNVPISN